MPNASAAVKVYGAEWCPPCHMAKNYFKSIKVEYDYTNIDHDQQAGQEIAKKTGWSAIPIIQIGDEYILGFDRPKIDGALRANKLV